MSENLTIQRLQGTVCRRSKHQRGSTAL